MSTPAWHPSEEVRAALDGGLPIVALESSVVTNGLPRERRALGAVSKFSPEFDDSVPVNLALAQAAEATVRRHGAVPATIALLDGRVHVGLDARDLERLASDHASEKVSLRDLGPLMASAKSGGTTVAATTAIAALAGIRVFSTGGIGGVHRGWTSTLDISADLHAISAHPVMVVSSGAKAILDLEATLEAIETLGIPAIGLGTGHLPRFTVESSERLPLPHRVDSAPDAAAVALAHWRIRPSAGLLLFNPCPSTFATPARDAEPRIAAALAEAAKQGIRGAATTPFLLSHLAECESGGATLCANLALLLANAHQAALVASALAVSRAR